MSHSWNSKVGGLSGIVDKNLDEGVEGHDNHSIVDVGGGYMGS